MTEVSFCLPFSVQSHKCTFTSESFKIHNYLFKSHTDMRRLYKTGFNTQSPQSLFHLKTLYCSKVICAQKYASFQFLIITCVLLLQLVTATGLWLNISTHRGLLTVIKTNKPLSSLTLEFEHEAHTGAVTPNLNTREEERQRREGQTRGGERALLPTFLPKRPLPPSTCCYH